MPVRRNPSGRRPPWQAWRKALGTLCTKPEARNPPIGLAIENFLDSRKAEQAIHFQLVAGTLRTPPLHSVR